MQIPDKVRILKRLVFRRLQAEKVLKATYETTFGRKLDCRNPQTFTAKMFRRMISINRNDNPEFSELADKYLARGYVARKLGDEYLVKLIWHGTDPRKIPFETLPDRCVIKTNHGSGGHWIVEGAVDREKVIKHFDKALKENYYWRARENQYYRIAPRILVEEFIDDGEPHGPLDFRFWCFNAVPELIQVDNHAHNINPFYDRNWNKLDLSYRSHFQDVQIAKPHNLNQMLAAASALAEGFDFVRVDLYSAKGRIYFGELTFTPRAGIFKFKPESWDLILGEKWADEPARPRTGFRRKRNGAVVAGVAK